MRKWCKARVASGREKVAQGGVLQCVAVCCSVLQCVAVCCSVLQSGREKVVQGESRRQESGARRKWGVGNERVVEGVSEITKLLHEVYGEWKTREWCEVRVHSHARVCKSVQERVNSKRV